MGLKWGVGRRSIWEKMTSVSTGSSFPNPSKGSSAPGTTSQRRVWVKNLAFHQNNTLSSERRLEKRQTLVHCTIKERHARVSYARCRIRSYTRPNVNTFSYGTAGLYSLVASQIMQQNLTHNAMVPHKVELSYGSVKQYPEPASARTPPDCHRKSEWCPECTPLPQDN